MFTIRNAEMEDLDGIVAIENLCFLKEEAALKETFEKRIQHISDSFFVAEEDGVVIGIVNGPVIKEPLITDDLFSDLTANPVNGGHQSILGLAVSPQFQKRGVASALLSHIEKEAKKNNRETIILTCKQNLISFYEKHGYFNIGVSSSNHGGAVWFNLIKKLT
jgi:ribosomal protein S18 acetylase RimI-like enzyme